MIKFEFTNWWSTWSCDKHGLAIVFIPFQFDLYTTFYYRGCMITLLNFQFLVEIER